GSACWAGFILLGAVAIARRPSLRAAALLSVPVAMSLMVGSPEQLAWEAMLAIAAIAVLARRARVRALLFGAGGFALGAGLAGGAVAFALLSLGQYFPPAAWALRIPPLSLFRFPMKYAVGCAFCLCVLAALGLDRLVARRTRRRAAPEAIGTLPRSGAAETMG